MERCEAACATASTERARRFEKLYAENGERIYRFCFRLSGRAADAEDLTQEVFLAAYQGLDKFAGRSSNVTWLYRIALYRWQRLRAQWQPETEALDESSAIVDQSCLQRLSLEAALGELPGDLHDAFMLVKVEGFKYREAASILEVPQGTIQWRVSQAMQRMRVLLGDQGSNKENQDDNLR